MIFVRMDGRAESRMDGKELKDGKLCRVMIVQCPKWTRHIKEIDETISCFMCGRPGLGLVEALSLGFKLFYSIISKFCAYDADFPKSINK